MWVTYTEESCAVLAPRRGKISFENKEVSRGKSTKTRRCRGENFRLCEPPRYTKIPSQEGAVTKKIPLIPQLGN